LATAPGSRAELSDFEIVDQVLAGAPGAVQEFYRRHSRLIYHCIRARADAQDVDDIFQAFFERLMKSGWRPLRLWQRGTSLPVYLATVVRNFVVDFHRSRRRREEAVGGDAELAALSTAEVAGPAALSHLKELRRIGIRAWALLEARDRRLVCDRLHRDLDNDVMALRLRLSAGALRTALSRAQARFLAEVRRIAPEFFPDRQNHQGA
jgi:RNA polymerase sigma factor (sigma-70 family)